MLELKDIKKDYPAGETTVHALKGVSLQFRRNEFVSILGPSGSGKTTLLNIIGGLDRYDKGDLIINNVSTKKYKDRDWDYCFALKLEQKKLEQIMKYYEKYGVDNVFKSEKIKEKAKILFKDGWYVVVSAAGTIISPVQ